MLGGFSSSSSAYGKRLLLREKERKERERRRETNERHTNSEEVRLLSSPLLPSLSLSHFHLSSSSSSSSFFLIFFFLLSPFSHSFTAVILTIFKAKEEERKKRERQKKRKEGRRERRKKRKGSQSLTHFPEDGFSVCVQVSSSFFLFTDSFSLRHSSLIHSSLSLCQREI